MRNYIVLCFFLKFTKLFSQVEKILVDKENSYVKYKASHFLHDWSGSNNNLFGALIINNTKIEKIAIIAFVKDFDSNNPNRDSHAHEVLEILKYPQIKFLSKTIDLSKKSLLVRGEIDFHGKIIEKDVYIEMFEDQRRLKLKGKFELYLTDFEIKLPSFMLKKIKDRINIFFQIEFIKEIDIIDK